MFKRIKIYLPFINAGMQETTTYRIDWIFGMLGNILNCFISFYLWKAIFESSGSGMMKGFTMPLMVVYIFMMFLTVSLIRSGGTYDIGEEIRDGSIAMRIIKPISYNATFLFQELGNKLMTICILIVPMVAAVEYVRYRITGGIQFNIVTFLLYIFSSVLAYLINFFFNICFGFIAFVIKYLWGANMMKNCIVGFLSGQTIPLAFFPDIVEKVLLILPFSSLYYTPVMFYMEMYTGTEIALHLGLQAMWVVFFYGLSKFLWHVSIKHLTVQGG